MKLADLPPDTLARLKALRWDRIVEKHEGPERWEGTLRHAEPEFLRVGAHDVLLPIPREDHSNVTVLRCLEAADGSALTVFLKDTTHVRRAEDERFAAGFLAVCERMPGASFFVASVYHEWFILDPFDRAEAG